mmetsp:Transcript_25061/g.38896  ORF Transcript_25061/g.38896 Transcript_25061/m.38896 type:complete len:144 (-) Transcript_25061:209-640(-)
MRNCAKKGIANVEYSHKMQKVAVCMAILDSEDKLLLTRRPIHMRNFPNAWVMPGGHVEFGESLEDCIRREIKEEVGITIKGGNDDETFLEEDEGEAVTTFEPYFIFESVSQKTFGTVPPSSGHLILFYKVQLEKPSDQIKLSI